MPSWQSSERTGVISYRLTRDRAVSAYHKGHRSALEVCDAQPELRRVAHHHASPLAEPCPICGADELGTVLFAFGPGLPRSGRLIADLNDMRQLRGRGRPSTCYAIEVCQSCWWNHLRESFPVRPAAARG